MEDDVSDDSIDNTSQGFRVLYRRQLPYPAREGLAAWSPQLDLFAVVTAGDNLLLYRINGQRVWGVGHKFGPAVTVERMRWRPDGKLLAVGYSDGKTRIYNVNSGKVIIEIASEGKGFGSVTCVGWVDNHSHTLALNQPPETKATECTPQAVFDLDVNSMLPRLCSLPSSAGPDSTFTSKTTLDALINSVGKPGDGTNLDVLLIGEERGKLLLNVFDSFLVGTMELSSLCSQLNEYSTLTCHRATSNLSVHALLLKDTTDGRTQFATMDILFIHQFGQYLHQLASTSTKVTALMRYMHETVVSLQTEFKTMNDLSNRFVSIIDEDLQKDCSEIGLELFEYLVTGIPSSNLKKVLMDVLPERSQKRWEKSSIAGYEILRRLVHENLLPTCERLTVLFCRLRGLARWKESGSPLGLEPDDFAGCLDAVSAITLFSHEFLLTLNHELDLFTAFASWLRHGLDQLATVVNIDDKNQEDPQVDTLKVAEFIGNHLKKSSLEAFFSPSTGRPLKDYTSSGEEISKMYRQSERQALVPGFMELAEYLREWCKTVFAKPQQAMRQQLRIGNPILLSKRNFHLEDMRLIVEGEGAVAYTLLYTKTPNRANLIVARFQIMVNSGFSSVTKVDCANVTFPHENQILTDMQFVDDRLLIMIVRQAETKFAEMVTMNYRSLNFTEHIHQRLDGPDLATFANTLPAQHVEIVSRRAFDENWVPTQVTVNGKEDRRVGCVIAEDRTRYQIFDLDHDEDEDSEEEDDSDMLDDSGEEEEEEEEEVDEEF